MVVRIHSLFLTNTTPFKELESHKRNIWNDPTQEIRKTEVTVQSLWNGYALRAGILTRHITILSQCDITTQY